jgi:hypothetical protein
MRRTPFAALCICTIVACSAAVSREARADSDSAAYRANVGFHLGFAPILLVPTGNGPLGGGLELDGRYGIPVGPVIIAPGARLAGYDISENLIGIGMPTARVTAPVGPFAPFVVGGIGVGYDSEGSGNTGAAFLIGGGLMIHIGDHFAIGAEATYQTITNTRFHELAIGPAIMISF